jgi:hypothetical protein
LPGRVVGSASWLSDANSYLWLRFQHHSQLSKTGIAEVESESGFSYKATAF